jgi:hypothetical protein
MTSRRGFRLSCGLPVGTRRPRHKANDSCQAECEGTYGFIRHSFVPRARHRSKDRQTTCCETCVCPPDDDNWSRSRTVLPGTRRDIEQAVRIHAGGRHGAPRARREAGRCDSSAPRSPCRSGRRGGTDRESAIAEAIAPFAPGPGAQGIAAEPIAPGAQGGAPPPSSSAAAAAAAGPKRTRGLPPPLAQAALITIQRCAISKECNSNTRSSTACTNTRAFSSPGRE